MIKIYEILDMQISIQHSNIMKNKANLIYVIVPSYLIILRILILLLMNLYYNLCQNIFFINLPKQYLNLMLNMEHYGIFLYWNYNIILMIIIVIILTFMGFHRCLFIRFISMMFGFIFYHPILIINLFILIFLSQLYYNFNSCFLTCLEIFL